MINEAVGCITDLEKWAYDTISIRTVLPHTVLSDKIDSDAGSAGRLRRRPTNTFPNFEVHRLGRPVTHVCRLLRLPFFLPTFAARLAWDQERSIAGNECPKECSGGILTVLYSYVSHGGAGGAVFMY